MSEKAEIMFAGADVAFVQELNNDTALDSGAVCAGGEVETETASEPLSVSGTSDARDNFQKNLNHSEDETEQIENQIEKTLFQINALTQINSENDARISDDKIKQVRETLAEMIADNNQLLAQSKELDRVYEENYEDLENFVRQNRAKMELLKARIEMLETESKNSAKRFKESMCEDSDDDNSSISSFSGSDCEEDSEPEEVNAESLPEHNANNHVQVSLEENVPQMDSQPEMCSQQDIFPEDCLTEEDNLGNSKNLQRQSEKTELQKEEVQPKSQSFARRFLKQAVWGLVCVGTWAVGAYVGINVGANIDQYLALSGY